MPCVRAEVTQHLYDSVRVITHTAIPAIRVLRADARRSISSSGEIKGPASDETLPERGAIVRLVFQGHLVLWDMEVRAT